MSGQINEETIDVKSKNVNEDHLTMAEAEAEDKLGDPDYLSDRQQYCLPTTLIETRKKNSSMIQINKETNLDYTDEKVKQFRDDECDCFEKERQFGGKSSAENSLQLGTIHKETQEGTKQIEVVEKLAGSHDINDEYVQGKDSRGTCKTAEGRVSRQPSADEEGLITTVHKNPENLSISTLPDMTPPSLCDPCSFDNEDVPSSAFCIDCLEYLCKICFRDHKKNKMTRGHRLLMEDDIPASKKPFEYMNSLVHCKNHPDKEIEYKCSDHNVYICSSCEGKSHRKCEHVTELQELTKIEEGRNVTGSLMQQIEDGIELVLEHNQCNDENITSMMNDTKGLAETLAEVKIKFDEYFDNFKKQLSQTADSLVRSQATNLKNAIEQGNVFITEREKEKKVLETAVKYGSPKQIYLVTQTMQETLTTLDERLQAFRGREQYQLKFLSNLENMTSLEFGSLKLIDTETQNEVELSKNQHQYSTKDDTDAGSDAVVDDSMKTDEMPLAKPLMNCTLRYNCARNICRYVCNIHGCVILQDKIILIDRNNSSLLMFSDEFVLKSHLFLPSMPLGLCSIDDTTIVVTLNNKTVQRYSVAGDSLNFLNDFSTGLHCRGIARVGDGVGMLMSDKSFDSRIKDGTDVIEIQVRKVENGQKLGVTNNFKDKSGRKAKMNDPQCLLFLESEKQIVIGEWKYLVSFNANMVQDKIFKSYKDHKIDDIVGLACDDEGNIYACGYGSNNVHQISFENFYVNRIIIPDIHHPRCLAFDRRRKRLIVCCELSNVIHEYQFTE